MFICREKYEELTAYQRQALDNETTVRVQAIQITDLEKQLTNCKAALTAEKAGRLEAEQKAFRTEGTMGRVLVERNRADSRARKAEQDLEEARAKVKDREAKLDTVGEAYANAVEELHMAEERLKDWEARYKRMDATLGKVQEERDAAEAKARQAQEAMEGAINDTTYWRHQFEEATKRAQELHEKLAEKEAENEKLKKDLEGVRVYELQRVFALDRKVMPPCCRF